ncbi:MAG: cupin domain-containing protein [Rhodobacteraceae bacterium]|nr:cupin domain-containing protein [Paracoccaceae bacterium]
MNVNADFSQRAVVHAADIPWVASPMAGVDRRMLDRIGDEVARATSIVRYAPGSAFSPHVHTGGEEFLVLDGVFQDEHGDFPVGTYVRNPPTSSHRPSSAEGATILVKLWQFDPEDRTAVTVSTHDTTATPDPARAGVAVVPLYRDTREDVRIEHWSPGARIDLEGHGGAEILVLGGGFRENGETFAEMSWLRLPPDMALAAVAGPEGARVWIKTGHLARPPRAPVTGA